MKRLGENIETKLLGMDFGSDFLGIAPEAQTTQWKRNK